MLKVALKRTRLRCQACPIYRVQEPRSNDSVRSSCNYQNFPTSFALISPSTTKKRWNLSISHGKPLARCQVLQPLIQDQRTLLSWCLALSFETLTTSRIFQRIILPSGPIQQQIPDFGKVDIGYCYNTLVHIMALAIGRSVWQTRQLIDEWISWPDKFSPSPITTMYSCINQASVDIELLF